MTRLELEQKMQDISDDTLSTSYVTSLELNKHARGELVIGTSSSNMFPWLVAKVTRGTADTWYVNRQGFNCKQILHGDKIETFCNPWVSACPSSILDQVASIPVLCSRYAQSHLKLTPLQQKNISNLTKYMCEKIDTDGTITERVFVIEHQPWNILTKLSMMNWRPGTWNVSKL